MKELFLIGGLAFLTCCGFLEAQTLPHVSPVISPDRLAASFQYSGNLDCRDITNHDMQDLVFNASDNSFFRVSIAVANSGSILTTQVKAALDAHPEQEQQITLEDGTEAYILQNVPLILMTSKDGRFDLKIGVMPPGDNIDIVKNEKNRRMLGDGTAASSRAILMEAVKEIYASVAENYDQLVREKEARKSAIMRRLHPSSAPSASNVPTVTQSAVPRPPSIQPTTAPVNQSEIGVSWWIYGGIIVGVGLFALGWFAFRTRR